MFDFDSIKRLSDTEKGDIFKRVTKIGEEYGEFCAALLTEDGYKVPKKKTSKAAQREHVLEEGIDLIQVALDALIAKGFTEDEISGMMNHKLTVWKEVLIKKGLINDFDFEAILAMTDMGDSPMPELIQNAVKCLECGEIIQSTSRHDFVKCQCPNNAMTDGGLEYHRYGAADMSKIEILSIHRSEPFESIKKKLLWGTYGKKGGQPLKYVLLNDCESDHLHAILKNVHGINPLHETVIVSILKDRGEFKQ
jgi:ribosomal protein L32